MILRAMPDFHAAANWKRWIIRGIAVFAATLFLTLCAKIQAPVGLVKVSLQPVGMILLGFVLGPKGALLCIGAYLLEGALGLPVFQSTPERGIGLAYMMGPTGGYLVGFLCAGYVAGLASRLKPSAFCYFGLSACCLGVMLLCGSLWLAFLFQSFSQAVTVGITPFLWSSCWQIGLSTLLGVLINDYSHVGRFLKSIF